MSYYFIKEAVRTDDTGNQYPQILEMDVKHDYLDDKGVYSFGRNLFPEDVKLENFLLDEQARVSDVLSTVMLRLSGFLVNKKVRLLLEQCNLPNHRFYNAIVKDKFGNSFEYFWLQIATNPDLTLLDFRKSEFLVEETGENIDISNQQEFAHKKNLIKPHRIKIWKVTVNARFQQHPLDLFKIPRFSISWIISDKLARTLIENGVTGIELTAISKDHLS